MKKILIIEDEKLQAKAYQRKLDREYEVIVAEDGNVGIKTAQSFQPDLIILDLRLPGGLNGFDVLRMLKSDPKTHSIIVLVLTNFDQEQEALALKEGAADYMVKTNTSLEYLEERIKHYIG